MGRDELHPDDELAADRTGGAGSRRQPLSDEEYREAMEKLMRARDD